MNKSQELMIKNQMITNNLLSIIATTALIGKIGTMSVKCNNNLDTATDDMVKSSNEFRHLLNK